MERPSTTDESFKKFLDDLQKQNNRSFVTQLLQLKYEKENADDDNDRREEQLNELISSFQKLEKAVTGFSVKFDVQPIVDSLENSNKILLKQLEELSLTRKLTEGSVEYDKGMAQYRNTSGRDVENLVSGKVSKTGQVIDFETASDRLTGQGKRAREANKLDLTPIEIAPGKKTTEALVPGKEDKEEKRLTGVEIKPDDRTWSEFFKDIKSIFGFKGGGNEAYSATKGRYAGEFVKAGKGTEQQGMLDYERRIKEEKEADQAKMFGFESKRKDGVPIEPAAGFEPIEDPEFIEKIKSSADIKNAPGAELKPTPAEANPESDNIESPAEIQNKMVKEDLELTKQSKTIFEQQLFELRAIREALGGSKPSGKGESGAKPQAAVAEKEKEEDSGPGLLDMLPGKGTLGKIGKGAASLGSKALKVLSGKGGAVLGGALAVGAGAYTAYKGYSAAEESKQAKMEQIQSQLDSGEIDEKQAASLRKEAGNTATVEKSSAVGEGTGMAAGGIAGMKAGAMIGTAFGGPIGTVVGGGLGLAAGTFLGSKAGKAVGGAVGKGIAGIKNFFGMGEGENVGEKTEEAVLGKVETVPGAAAPTSSAGSKIGHPSFEFSKDVPSEDQSLYMDAYTKARDSGAGIKDAQQIARDTVKASRERKSMEQGAPEARAKGGPVEDGADYIVGEKGPELFMPFKDGVVIPNDLSKKLAPKAVGDGKAGLATGGIALEGGITDYNQLSEKGKSYHKFKLQLSNLFSLRGPGGSGVFEDIDPDLKKKQEEFIKAGEELGSKLDSSEKSFVDSIFAENIRAKSEKDVGDLQSRFKDDSSSSVAPKSSQLTGPSMSNISTENQAMRDQAATSQSGTTTVINNVSGGGSAPNFIPMKASPRPDSTLNRYQDRVAAY